MKVLCRSMFVLVVLAGCSGQEEAAAPTPERVEEMRLQYIEQAKAFNAEAAPERNK